MESSSFKKTSKNVISDEEYKEMWMSLFDISVISSCNGKDPDLFCASALLKTAFYAFIKLKRRLIETEELIENQRLDLEAYERERKFVKSRPSSLTSAVCFRCGDEIGDYEWLPEGASSNLQHTIQSTDKAVIKDARIHSRSSTDEISYSLKEKLVSKIKGGENSLERIDSKVPEISAVNLVSLSPLSKYYNHQKDAQTPKKRKSQAESQNVSPILKHFKKPRISPAMTSQASKCGKMLLKSPSLFPSETIRKDVSSSGLFTAGRNISPDSLKNCAFEEGTKEESPEALKSSENEEDEMILPSPVSPQCVGYFSSKGTVTPHGVDEEDTRNKKRKVQTISMNQGPSDSEATFFFPMEELEGRNSEDEGKDDLIDEECNKNGMEHVSFLNSFDQVPLKSDSPSYRYQRVTVRKKKERRKLFGWECKDCQKYYEAAGLSAGERRDHLNKCSRHRDKFSPEDNLPQGFWNPVFPETQQ